MADKIASFEEYKNKEAAKQDKKIENPLEQARKEEPVKKPEPSVNVPVSQETLEIEIEDPFKFLDENEREEYIIERQKERNRERKKEAIENASTDSQRAPAKKEARHSAEERNTENRESVRGEKHGEQPHEEKHREQIQAEKSAEQDSGVRPHKKEETPEERLRRRHSERIREDFRREEPIMPEEPHKNPSVREQVEEVYDEPEQEPYEDEEPEGGINMELVVRIASILTGIVILAFIAMLVKTKVYDQYLAPDPDEAEVAVSALPAGYTEKNDIVTVSGASSLNLRSVPSTESKETVIATVNEGTELKRIAVSEDGSWALLDYNGQQLYGAMKYLKEN